MTIQEKALLISLVEKEHTKASRAFRMSSTSFTDTQQKRDRASALYRLLLEVRDLPTQEHRVKAEGWT